MGAGAADLVKLVEKALEMRIVQSKRAIAKVAGVNAGQLSNYIRSGGPLSMENEFRVLEVVLFFELRDGGIFLRVM
jgi:hypothetical protein